MRKQEARALFKEAKVSLHRNRLNEAAPLLRRAVDLFEQEVATAEPHEETIISLLAQKEKRLSYADALVSLAAVLEQQGEYEEAVGLLRKAVDNLQQLPTPPLDLIASIQDRLALVLEKEGRFAEADEALVLVLKNLERLGNEGREDSREALVHKRRERVLQKEGVLEERLRDAIRKYEKAYGPDHVFVGRGVYHLALLMEEEGRDVEAEALYKRAMKIHENFLGPDHPAIANFLIHLAQLLRNRGDFDHAQIYLKRTLAIFEKTLRETEPERLDALKNMVLRARLDEDTKPYLESIIEMEKRNFGPGHPNVGRSLRYLAMYMESQGNYADARKTLMQALEIFKNNFSPDHPEILLTMQKLAGLCDIMGKHDEAIQLSEEVLKIQEQESGKDHPATSLTIYRLSLYHLHQGNREAADRYLRKALALYETSLGPKDMFVATILDHLAENCVARGMTDEAQRFVKRSREIRQGVASQPGNPDARSCPMRMREAMGPARDASSRGALTETR